MRHKLRLQAVEGKLEAGRKERESRLRRYRAFREILGRTLGHMSAVELDEWAAEQFERLEAGRRSPREVTDESVSAWAWAKRGQGSHN